MPGNVLKGIPDYPSGPSARCMLPSVVTWRLPDIAVVFLLEVEPRKLLLQCSYVQPESKPEAGCCMGTMDKQYPKTNQEMWTEAWSFPFIRLLPGRTTNERDVVRMVEECFGLIIDLDEQLEVRGLRNARKEDVRMYERGGPCRLYHAHIVSQKCNDVSADSACSSAKDRRELAKERATAGLDSDGLVQQLVMTYTRFNPHVAEVGVMDVCDLEELAMSVTHHQCRLVCMEALGVSGEAPKGMVMKDSHNVPLYACMNRSRYPQLFEA